VKKRGFFADAYSEKDEILHSADAPFRMTPFLSPFFTCYFSPVPFFTCHPEAKPKGLLRGFFPFASLRVRMTRKGSDDVLSQSPELMRRGSEGSAKG